MTISSTNRKAGPFTGNGVQTTYAFAFKVFQASDLLVTRAIGGVEAALTLGTDYTVALNADQDAAPGGSITLTAPLANLALLAISSNVDSLQSVLITNAGGFFPAVFNTVFDKLTILVQQLAEKMGRALTIPITNSGVTNLTVPVLAGGVLQWAGDGSQLLAMSLPDLSLNLALPNQTGKAGQFLTTNGALPAWSLAPVTSVATLTGAITAAALKAKLIYTTADLADARTRLAANRTYFVRADGSDANDGSANTAGSAFLTLQKAIDTVHTLDLNGFTVTIQVGSGTYAGSAVLNGPIVGQKTPSQLVIQGDVATPANVIFSFNTAGGLAFSAMYGARCQIKGVKFSGTALNSHVACTGVGRVEVSNCEFGATANSPIYAFGAGSHIEIAGACLVSGGGPAFMYGQAGGMIRAIAQAITLSGTPAFSVGFALATGGGAVETSGCTFPGTGATGPRYNAGLNGIINTYGGGASYFPGSTVGVTATGGQYA